MNEIITLIFKSCVAGKASQLFLSQKCWVASPIPGMITSSSAVVLVKLSWAEKINKLIQKLIQKQHLENTHFLYTVNIFTQFGQFMKKSVCSKG